MKYHDKKDTLFRQPDIPEYAQQPVGSETARG